MKKSIFCFAIAFLVSSNLFSQENDISTDIGDTQTNFNELKINGIIMILGAFEVSYERTINEESAFGISALLPFDDLLKGDVKYYISPYYRFYFGKKYAAGFFVEGFGMLNSLDRSIAIISSSGDDFVTDFALGFALGAKWVTKKGFSVEWINGVGRNLLNNSETDYSVVFKAGVNLGYRF